MSPQACRMCLAVDGAMFSIANTPLQQVYEDITKKKLQSADGKPVMACYICRCMLAKCDAFIKKSLRADHLLQQVVDRKLELTSTAISSLDSSGLKLPLVVSPVVSMEWVEHMDKPVHNQMPLVIKVEREYDDMAEDATEDCLQQSKDELLSVMKTEQVPLTTLAGERVDRSVLVKWEDPQESLQHNETKIEPRDASFWQNIEIAIEIEEQCTDSTNNGTECTTIQEKESQATDFTLKTEIITTEEEIESQATDLILKKDINTTEEQKESQARDLILKTDIITTEEEIESQATDVTLKKDVTTTVEVNKKRGDPHPCKLCDKAFKFPSQLVLHERTHTGRKPYSCTYCKKSFFRKGNLNRHIFVHTGEKRFPCTFCSKAFTRPTYLRAHLSSHTGEKLYICQYCSKSFAQLSHLKTHINLHTGEKRYECDYCNRSFLQRNTIMNHIKLIHMKIPMVRKKGKSHNCPVCNKVCTSKSNMTTHMTIHTGERKFKCDLCVKTFSLKNTLKTHLLTHTGVKPFSCNVCGKAFAHKETLKKHARIHTGEKPYRCDRCEKGFGRKDYLDVHKLTHIDSKQHTCYVCGSVYKHKTSLSLHLKTHGVSPR